MKKIFALFSLINLLILFSCDLGFYASEFGNESVDSRSSQIIELPSEENPSTKDFEKYSFVLFSDVHVGDKNSKQNRDKLISWLKKQMAESKIIPRFSVSLGDNMNSGTEWKEYNEFLFLLKNAVSEFDSSFDFKTYSTVGNHDLYHNGWENYKKYIYPYSSSYKFTDGTFSFYVIDSANGTLGKKQRDSLENCLKADSNPKIIFSHVPFYAGGCPTIAFTMQNTMERNKILTLCQEHNVKQVFAGHAHINYGCNYGSWREDVIGSLKKGVFYLITIDKKNKTVKFEL